ncbi:MAG: hypothetical protein A6F70_05170 [Cycloclasticus sp. symbiont of Bathymodiolus heckerae]|nr:MAG: hypothetical protein A6F70_05170 [Cycloclasticus sp. symbiont of Bathymodiolus heckerae]
MIRHQCPHPYHQTKRQRQIEKYTLLVVIGGLVLFFTAGRCSVKSVDEYQAENNLLQVAVVELTKENKELLKQQDFVENAQKIDAQAQKDSRRALTELHGQLSEVKQKLAFYQRVVAPETIVKGLYLDSFEIRQVGKKRLYQYQLVVAQGVSQKRAVKGRYSLSVTGMLNGKEKTLLLKEMLVGKEQPKGFSFRYYELLKGELEFEEGFSPVQISVVVTPSTKGSKEIRQQWAWRDAIV